MKRSSLGWMTLLFVAFSLFGTSSKAQDFATTLAKATEAAELGNYIDAERHWLRAIYFSKSENRFEPAFGLGGAYFGQNRLLEAARQYDFAAHLAPTDSLRAICFFKESQALLLIPDFKQLRNRLNYLGKQADSMLESRRQFYLGNANFGLGNAEEAELNFKACTENAFVKAKIHDAFWAEKRLFKKNPKVASIFSYFVPGTGQLIAGKPDKALNAVILVGAIAVGGVYAISSIGLLPAIIIVGPTLVRYHLGSALRAGQLYEKKLNRKKKKLLNEVFNILEKG